jgi:hypothetical protein
MSSRKRSARPVGNRNTRRSTRLFLEDLESRIVLSPGSWSFTTPYGELITSASQSVSAPTAPGAAKLGFILASAPTASPQGPPSGVHTQQFTGPIGYSPQQLNQAYETTAGITLAGGIVGNGAGQTIAVVDPGDNPAFLNFTGGAAVGALAAYDAYWGIPNPPSLQKYDGQTGAELPNNGVGFSIGDAGVEIALDIESAHAMAPDAKIDLVESTQSAITGPGNLMKAAETAASLPGVSVVSMSFGGYFEFFGEGAIQKQLDKLYLAPAEAANPGVTFLASTGDNSNEFGPIYPSVSPLVVGVGGTSLYVKPTTYGASSYSWGGETAWSGGGGGISNTYTEPTWQESVQSTGFRTVPDISADANPNTGLAVYDPYDFGASTPWDPVGGTSLSSPTWAGLVAIADQGRVLLGGTTLGGPAQTLPELYALDNGGTNYVPPGNDSSGNSYYHDITQGTDFIPPTVGYDLATGIGSPVGNHLLPALASYGLASQAVITIQPPSSVIAQGQFGLIVQAETPDGTVDPGFTGTGTLSLSSGPVGATFTPVAVQFSQGVGVFDGISLSQLSNGTDYIFQVSLASGTTTFPLVTTTPVDVSSPATPGVGVFYPLPIDSSLHRDVNLADSDSVNPTNVLYLVYSTDFASSSGELVLENTSTLSNKDISIIGQGEATSVITANQSSRVFDIVDTSATSTLSVLFQDLSIEGGRATDDAGLNLPQTVVGGGLVFDGGNVTMSNVAVKSNVAAAVNGTNGSPGAPGVGGTGGNGGNGGKARGGGFFLASGSLTLNNDTISGNLAQGGAGGIGGPGGAGYTLTSRYDPFTAAHTGGAGGKGGNGGVATGGAAYIANGVLNLDGVVFQSNQAAGGAGGAGGHGGHGGFFSKPGGPGGNGGNGAAAFGGGLFISGGTLSLTATTINKNAAVGGQGGAGGSGGTGGTTSFATTNNIVRASSGASGVAGASATGAGGGIYLLGGAITWTSAIIEANQANFGGGIYNEIVLSLDAGISIANNIGFSGGGGGGLYNAGTLTLTGGVTLSGNSDGFGGGVDNRGTLTVDDGHFVDNVATNGSGGAIDNVGLATIENNSVFSGNSAGFNGGAIYNAASETLTVTDSTFSGNSNVAGAGGGIYNLGNLTLNTSTFTDNASGPDSGGGGVWNNGALTVADTTFTGNSADSGYGGGLYNNATLTVVNSTFSTNTAQGGFGGAIMNDLGGTLTLTDSTVSGNTAYEGGGLFSQSTTVATITGDTFNANTANDGSTGPFGFGGAIYNNGLMAITNSTLADNTSAFAGGGIDNNSGTLTLIYDTIVDNSAATANTNGFGGGLDANGGTITLYDSIVAQNTNNFTILPDDISTLVGGTISASSAYNLIGTGGSGGLTNGVNGNQVGVTNPGLSPAGLANNGGDTQTIALLPDSPAITPGGSAVIPGVTLPITDQRGILRGTSVDIGAYQVGYGYLVTNTADSYAQGTLRSALAWANLNVAPSGFVNTILFDTADVFATPQTITLTSGIGLGTLELTNTTTTIAIDYTGTSTVDISAGNAFEDFLIDSDVKAIFTDLTISGGSGSSGGGIDNKGSLTLNQVLITGNTATGQGGGIMNDGKLAVVNSTFSDNTASLGGGIAGSGPLSVVDSSFSDNTASATGGAIAYSGPSGSAAAVTGSSFSGNQAQVGGAIYVGTGTLTITASTLTSNTAKGQGGGIENAGTLNILDSTLADNSANGGGGLDNPGTATLTNITITGNSAAAQGGGIQSAGTLTLVNDTIAVNSVAGAGVGGGLNVTAGTAILGNTIVALNTNGSGASDIAGTVSGSHNVVGAGGSGGLTNGTSGNQTNITGAQLNLAALGNYGGATETMALLTGSVAIDAGATTISGLTVSVPTLDQRGAERGPAGVNAGSTPDVGAYEASSSFLVTNTLDAFGSGTLRSAVSWANVNINDNPANLTNPAPNTIRFDSSPGGTFATPQTITLSASLGTLGLNDLTTGIAIDGPGASNLTIDGNKAITVFSIGSGVTVGLSGLTISDGLAAGGAGGAINNAGILTISNSTISNNSAAVGGGVYNQGTLTLNDSTIADNTSTGGNGGGIDNTYNTLTGISGSLTIENSSTISGNSATGLGGGVYNQLDPVTITASTITGNTAATGGGVANSLGTVTISTSTFTSNSATGAGGAIDNSSGTVTITYSTIGGNTAGLGNTAGGNGGGIENVGTLGNAGTLTATGSTFASNTSAALGGGIDNNGGTASLVNDTVSSNTASSGGGVSDSSPMSAINVTIAYNVVGNIGAGGGLYVGLGGAVTLDNTIVALNTRGGVGGPASDIALSKGTLSPFSSYNLVGTGGSGGMSNTSNSNQVNVPASGLHLGTLASNGGPTQTIALLAGSLAIDGGATQIPGVSVPNVDQRGALRGPAGLNAGSTVDVGAYEASSSYLVTTTLDSMAVGSIRAAIDWASFSTNANPANAAPNAAPNTVVFDTTGEFATPQTIDLSGPLVLSDLNPTGLAIVGPGQNGVTISGSGLFPVVVINPGVTATLLGLTISGGNAGSGSGGGIENSGTLTLSADTITGNSAGSGGGVFNAGPGTLTLFDTTVSGNTGGGIDNAGTLKATNSTIADNTGGGILATAGALTSVNVTIAYNAGGGLDVTGGTATLDNTIVALNTGGDITGTVTVSGSFNLIGTGGSGGLTNGINGNQVDVSVANVGLAPGLANNGGPTQTIALLPTSVAIQAGSASVTGVTVPTTDQRGAERNPGALNNGTTVDIGAYELSSSYLVTTTADNLNVGTLRAAVVWADLNASSTGNPNTISFSPLVFSSTSPQTITLSQTLGTLDLTNTSTPTMINGPGIAILTVSGADEIGIFSVASGVSVTITGMTLTQGSAAFGGAIDSSGNLSLVSSALVNNNAIQSANVTTQQGEGGAIYNNHGSVMLMNTTLSNNSAIYYGGGIYNDGGTVTINATTLSNNSAFSSNSATYGIGGGIDNTGTLSIANSTIANNTSFYGGGVDNSATGTAMITNTTINGNTGSLGGGIWNDGSLSVSASTVSNNISFDGGGIGNNLPGTLMLVNSTIANNSAAQFGGGIDNVGTFTAVNDTIAYNVVAAGGSGGGLASTAGTASLYNTIVVNNTIGSGTSGSAGDISGTVAATSAYNLIGIGGAGGLAEGVNGNQVGVASSSAMLGVLAANGGPTQTIALLTGSPAIGAGSSTITGVAVPTTDQRGDPRPAGSIDIGAYQTEPVITPPILIASPTVVATKPLDQNAATTPVSANATAVAQSVSTSSSGVVTPGGAHHAVKKVIGKGRPKPNGGSTGVFHKTTHKVKVATKHVSIAAKHVNAKRAKT